MRPVLNGLNFNILVAIVGRFIVQVLVIFTLSLMLIAWDTSKTQLYESCVNTLCVVVLEQDTFILA